MSTPPKYPQMPATLQASPPIRPPMPVSVSEQIRAAKEALKQPAVQEKLLTSSQPVPVTGQYYDVIRATQQVRTSAPPALTNPYVRGINNKAGGVKSFAAANYNYPSGQMVIGASLAGCSTCSSPSEDRKAQMAKLLGLGAVEGEATDMLSALEQIQAITSLLGTLPAIDVGPRRCDFNALLNEAIKYLRKNPTGAPAVCSSILADIDAVLLFDQNSAQAGQRVLSCAMTSLLQLAPKIAAVCPLKDAAPPASPPPAASPVLTDQARERIRALRARNAPQRTITLPASRSGRTFVFNVAPPAPASSNTPLILGGVAVAAVAAFFLLRNK